MKTIEQLPQTLEWWLIGVGVILLLIAKAWMRRRVGKLVRIDPMLGFLAQASSRGLHPESIAEQVQTYRSAGLLTKQLLLGWVAWLLVIVGILLGTLRHKSEWLPYVLALLMAIIVMAVGKSLILKKLYIAYRDRKIGLFAGRNTWLVIEAGYKTIRAVVIAVATVAILHPVNTTPRVWVFAIFGLPLLREDVANHFQNVRSNSPRPTAYFLSWLVADAVGLAVGFLVWSAWKT